MATANVYLNFNGNCEEAFQFYKSVFETEFSYFSRFKDVPPQEGMPELPKEMEEMVMHVSIPISKETILMGSDTGGEWAPTFTQGNNFSISLNTTDREEAERLFERLSDGGQITMPMEKTFWSESFGMLTDKFGINWMVSHDPEE